MGNDYNWNRNLPCRNPQCRSFGRSHPNCECAASGGIGHAIGHTASGLWNKAKGFATTAAENLGAQQEGYAAGGEVHHCSTGMPHLPECPHFAEGGLVHENMQFAKDPALSVDHAALGQGLLHTLKKTGHGRSQDHAGDFMEAAKRGRKALDDHAKNLLNPKADPIESNDEDADALGAHLDEIQMNPSLAENVGGKLGDSLPDHHLHLANKLASALNHFSSIKPKSMQGGPLDKITPPSKMEQAAYKRQLAIAQNPALIYQRAKNAQLQPGDRETLQAVYPKLHQQMVNAAGDAVVDHAAQGLELPKHAKRGLGQLMGQDLGFIHTPAAMAAIMQANAPPQQAAPGKPAQRARNKAVDESNKQAQLEATADQAREFGKKGQ